MSDRYIDDHEILKQTITVGTHFFRVNNPNPKTINVITQFANQYRHLGPSAKRNPDGRIVYEVKARFFRTIPLKNEFRFHIEQLDGLLTAFEAAGIGPSDIEIIDKQYTTAPEVKITIKDGWILRDYQLDVKAFILNKDISPSKSRLASLPTGTGKTVIAICTAAELNCAIGIPVPAGYSEKWKGDVLEQLNLSEEDVYMVNSRAKLIKAVKLADEGTKYKVYIFNQETLASFYKEYETAYFKGFEEHFGVHPEDIFEKLGIGVTIIDETHEAINMVFGMFAYTNVPLVIGLSGTLRSRDPFLLRIQKLLFPASVRYEKIRMAKYINFLPTSYTFMNLMANKIKLTYNGTMYSQAAYEDSILKSKNRFLLKNFLKMIDTYFKEDFIDQKKDGERAAIYFARVDMCELVVAFLKNKYPTMDIRKYTGEDPFENAIESEVRVTTRGSCGTAIDIKKLVSLITFDNVDSDVGNLQLLGRLRENKETDTVPRFRQLYCSGIPKHVQYQKNRHEVVMDRVKNITYSRYTTPLDSDPDRRETLRDYA